MKRSSVWVLAFVCSILFFSCDNFLKGANIKRELDDAIEIANSKPVTIYVTVEPGSGSVNVERVSAKRKQSFDLVFTPSSSWQFVRWEVYDRQTGQRLDDAISFENPLSPDTKFTVTKALENLEIRPRCLLVQVTPEAASKNWANIPIKIQFNVPVDASVASSIKIEYGGVSLQDLGLFEAPVLNADQTLITITPKPNELAAYITSQNLSVIKIDITLGTSIKTQSGETILLSEKFKSYSVWYETAIEREKPVINDFFVTRTPLTPEKTDSFAKIAQIEKFVQKTEADLTEGDIKQNRAGKFVYIYGHCYDKDSGVKTVVISQERTNDERGFAVPPLPEEQKVPPKIVTKQTINLLESDNENFWIEDNGNVRFCVKLFFDGNEEDYKNGAILLTVQVVDGADNSSEIKKLTAIKKVGSDGFSVTPNGFGYDLWHISKYKSSYYDDPDFKFDYEQGLKSARTLTLSVYELLYSRENLLTERIYCYLGGKKLLCKYTDKTGNMVTKECVLSNGEWIVNFENEIVNGLMVTFIVQDDIGNVATDTFTFPSIALSSMRIDSPNNDRIVVLDGDFSSIPYNYGCSFVCVQKGLENERDIVLLDTYYPGNEIVLEAGNTYYLWGVTTQESTSNGYATDIICIDNNFSYNSSDVNTMQLIFDRTKDIRKSSQKESIDFLFHINQNYWNLYDMISVQLSGNNVNYSYGSTDIALSIPFKNIKNQNLTASIIGYNYINGILSKTGTGSLPIFSLSEDEIKTYDNTKPRISIIQTDYENFEFSLRDDDSGPLNATITTDGGKVIILNAQNNYTKTLAIWDYNLDKIFYGYGNNFIFSYEASDQAENEIQATDWITAENNFPYKFEKITTDNYDSSNVKMTLSSIKLNSTYHDKTNWILYVSQWGSSWSAPSESSISYFSDAVTEQGFCMQIEDIVVPKNKYIMVRACCDPNFNRTYYTTYSIFYTGSAGTTNGKSDLLMPNGNSTDSVAIQSDAPVFVHTLVTDEPYEVCKNWSITEWESYKKHIGDEVFNFTTASFQRYDIPVGQITAGQCYCVIAHYATNKAIQSEVMVRN